MKVILKESIETLGKAGDAVKVADGYARNYLFPKGFAIPATKGAEKMIASLRRANEKREAELLKQMKALGEKIVAERYVISCRSGEEGKLFGSVTNQDVANALEAKGFEIDKRKVSLKEPIHKLGEYEASVKLAPEYSVQIAVIVVEA